MAAVFSPNNDLLASGSYDSTVGLWWVRTGELMQQLKGRRERVSSVTFSPDSALVASASGDKTGRLWRIDGGECMHVVHSFIRMLTRYQLITACRLLVALAMGLAKTAAGLPGTGRRCFGCQHLIDLVAQSYLDLRLRLGVGQGGCL